jgi:hypothetical protein
MVEVVKPASTNSNSNTKHGNDLLQTYEKEYPDPRTLPAPPPPSHELLPQLTLSELTAGKYVSTTARIVFLRTVER